MTEYKNHHYVPEWYQKRFIQGDSGQYYHLDLAIKNHPKVGNEIQRPQTKGVGQCFYEEDLYTNFLYSDPKFIEKIFYGTIEDRAARTIHYMSKEFQEGSNEGFLNFLDFIDALRFRTPRGLKLLENEFIKSLYKPSKENVLLLLNEVFRCHQVMWREAKWFYLSAEKSTRKFIISDNPITFFNEKIKVGEQGIDIFMRIGTVAVIPIDLNTCLVIYHQDFGNSRTLEPTQFRKNARIRGVPVPGFTPDYLIGHNNINNKKDLDGEEIYYVNRLNKEHADRYIAGNNKEDLFPEKHITEERNILEILLPKSTPITKETFWSTTDGKVFGVNEYGEEIDNIKANKEYQKLEKIMKEVLNKNI